MLFFAVAMQKSMIGKDGKIDFDFMESFIAEHFEVLGLEGI